MNELDLVVLLSRWLHIGAVIVAIGGSAFIRFVLLPSAEAVLDDDQHGRLRQAVRTRWARFVMISIAILIVTGSINFVLLALQPHVKPMPYHGIFAIKVLAAFGIFFIASALTGKSPAFDGLRAHPRKWLSLMLVLAGMIVLLSGVLGQLRGSPSEPIPTVTGSPAG